MEDDLPYRAEYAKSGRASCRGCKSNIGKDTLRLAVLVQSPAFDGKVTQWYHYTCFFGKQRPKTVDDIQHFESLRWEDQEKIKEKIKTLGDIVVPEGKGKGKKRAASAATGALGDFRIELAKSGRATCRGCEQKIVKEEVRIAKKDFTTEVGKKYGGQDMWHHLNCFAKLRSELGYYASGDCLPGYNSLAKAEKDVVKKQLPAIKQEESEPKKIKKDEGTSDEDSDIVKEQLKLIYKYRDLLKAKLTKTQLQELLEANDQAIPVGQERMLDRLSDLMAFGKLLPCASCGDGQLEFNKFGYQCKGDLTEWTKCAEIIKEPPREKFIVPKELAAEHSFLKKYKCVIRNRIIKDVKPTAVKKEEDQVDAKPKVERERPPLYNMDFVLLNVDNKDKLKKAIGKLGGKITTKITATVMAVISNEGDVEKMGARITAAKDSKVHVVGADFVKDASTKKYDEIFGLIEKKSICDWGSDPAKRVVADSTSHKSHSKSIYTKSMPKSVTMKLKGGTAVDPDSGLEDCAHVYVDGAEKYTAVLGVTDLQKQKNSYYKLQLLQADNSSKFWLFRAWGRIGTTIGGNKLEKMDSLIRGKQAFEELYEEKTGNEWSMRHDFEKVPGRMYPIDVDYTDETDNMQIDTGVPSTLPAPVQKLMQLIFNINDMKRVMLEFELDTEKMPLGKLSKSQIKKAYAVLTELQSLIAAGAATSQSMFIDASNRFYTFVPHSAGVDALPVLKENEQIKQKIDMMDSLMELEIAYSLMKASSSGSVDSHYEQLKSDIGVLERDSPEFAIIEEYVKNTHAPTHDAYEVVVTEVFTVKRQGEEKRFKPFKKMHNRRLLWHGSRVTNFAGIISQGLRIAPPEAPVTGYMFGKGVYFADMVTKSANYCCTTPTNSTGLLLLCDVALGDMMELKDAKNVTKLPTGKHSCKGLGMTCPDPAVVKKIGDVEVPLGKPTKVKTKTSLLYNEFIVYDVAQVNIRYLVQASFKYKKY